MTYLEAITANAKRRQRCAAAEHKAAVRLASAGRTHDAIIAQLERRYEAKQAWYYLDTLLSVRGGPSA